MIDAKRLYSRDNRTVEHLVVQNMPKSPLMIHRYKDT